MMTFIMINTINKMTKMTHQQVVQENQNQNKMLLL